MKAKLFFKEFIFIFAGCVILSIVSLLFFGLMDHIMMGEIKKRIAPICIVGLILALLTAVSAGWHQVLIYNHNKEKN